MTDTKKEHYVPRCYLKNFASHDKRIDLFDKWKVEVRKNQVIMNIAMENNFYDLDILGLLNGLETSEVEKAKPDLMKIVGTDCWEDVEKILANDKYLENEHFSPLEAVYKPLLESLINKSHNGHSWVMRNCSSMSESEKVSLALFVAIQITRTKRFRDTLGDMIAGAAQMLAYKSQMHEEDALPKEAFEVKANPEFVKLHHSALMLSPEISIKMANTLLNHIWVMHVNKTDIPFYTSDDPVVKIPHKNDKFRTYSGFASEAIEIAFPISPSLLLCMYDKKTYGDIFTDRQFWEITDPDEVIYYNWHQVHNSYRYVFSNNTDFEKAKEYCKNHPEHQSYLSQIEVL